MKKYFGLLMAIMVCKFSLNYWVMLTPTQRQNAIMAVACEFAQKARGKARAYAVVNPTEWTAEIHAEIIEEGT